MSTNTIHPTAIVDINAKIGESNYIGPFCIIGPNVTIGSNNRFEAYISIGTSAEHRDYFRKAPGKVLIGNDNNIRESVTINAGTTGVTTLGSEITILRGSHIGHDAIIQDKVTLSCNVLIGGHSVICTAANIGLSACIHQNRVVGALAMVGMNSSVTRNALPFLITFGSPAEPQRVNLVGLKRFGVSENDIVVFERWFINLKSLYERNINLRHDFNSYLEEFYNFSKALDVHVVNI